MFAWYYLKDFTDTLSQRGLQEGEEKHACPFYRLGNHGSERLWPFQGHKLNGRAQTSLQASWGCTILSLTTRVWLFPSVSGLCTFLCFLLLHSPYNFQFFRFPRDIELFLCPTLKILVLFHNGRCTYLKRKWCRFWYWCRMTSSFSPCVYCSINFILTPKKKKKIPDSAPHMRDFLKNSFSSTKMLVIVTSDFKISWVCVSFSHFFFTDFLFQDI